MNDPDLAAALAQEAGDRLVELRARPQDDSQISRGRLGDLESNQLLLRRLRAERPGDAVLSEESLDDPARLEAGRVWIIDPLDGTREYGLRGRTDWAVHVALWEANHGLTAAAVAQPGLGVVYGAHTARAADRKLGGPRILISDTRPPSFAERVAHCLGAEAVPMGSAGAKTMAVVRGEADAYLHAGGQWEWDSAAPVAVARAAGLHASRIDGSPLRYNQSNPYLPDLLICRPEIAELLLTALQLETD